MNDLAGERLAIKLLLADFRHNREEVGYMRHEFQVGRKLEHRRVIHIHEFGIDGDNIFLNQEKRVRAGLCRQDSVLGAGNAQPFGVD